MVKKIFFISLVFLFIYYTFTFFIGFAFLAKHLVNNDSVLLSKYINSEQLRNNIYKDIYEFSSKHVNSFDKNINIKSDLIEFQGELTPSFLKKLFSRMAHNISLDFSNSEVLLYFYKNSAELSEYLDKSFNHFGNYNFAKYISDKEKKDEKSEKKDEKGKEEEEKDDDKNKDDKKEKEKEELENLILRLIKKYQYTEYFFLTSPIHFKIEVKHQEIPFTVILKFNGYKWKVNKIKVPYDQLINLEKIKYN